MPIGGTHLYMFLLQVFAVHLSILTAVYIYITAPPVIVANTHKYTTTMGSQAVLRCDIIERGIPPATFSWKKNGYDLSSVYPVSVNGSILKLQLSYVTVDSSGVYVCTASNKLSYHTDIVELIVKRKYDAAAVQYVVCIKNMA